jgi:hypothetical protein
MLSSTKWKKVTYYNYHMRDLMATQKGTLVWNQTEKIRKLNEMKGLDCIVEIKSGQTDVATALKKLEGNEVEKNEAIETLMSMSFIDSKQTMPTLKDTIGPSKKNSLILIWILSMISYCFIKDLLIT